MSDYNMNVPEDAEKIVIEDEDGEKHLFEILFTFDVDSTGKSYMVLTPEGTGDSDDEEEVEVYPVRYEEPDGEEYKLSPIETDEEWEMVEELLNTFSEQLEEE